MLFKKVSEIDREQLPRKNGVYFFKVSKNVNLHGFENLNNNRIIYIGRAAGNKKTIFNRFGNHIENNSGFSSSSRSTFRRSIGAILKKDLKLVAYPRISAHNKPNSIPEFNFIKRTTIEDQYINKHIDDHDKEDDLTSWMSQNLKFHYIVSKNPKALEDELIEKYQPSLNKSKHNPLSDKLFNNIRKECRDEAKNNCLKIYGYIPDK